MELKDRIRLQVEIVICTALKDSIEYMMTYRAHNDVMHCERAALHNAKRAYKNRRDKRNG